MAKLRGINSIDPFVRLSLLEKYMRYYVDRWPKCKYTFHEFIYNNHRNLIPGRPEYYRDRATHCFYCPARLVCGDNHSHPRRASIDHYSPKSRGAAEKYVICCAACNTNKDNRPPSKVASMLLRGYFQGKTIWGYSGKVLKGISDQFQKIENDLIFNTGPKVYFIRK